MNVSIVDGNDERGGIGVGWFGVIDEVWIGVWYE